MASEQSFFFRLSNKLTYFFEDVQKSRLQKKVKAIKERNQGFLYNENPTISVIIQFFNKKKNIKKIIESLRNTSIEEIIVIDDGSVDGSYREWIKYLDRPNDFLLRCNDIYEVRTYDKAIRMARGKYVCLLQDDDIPPPNNSWIEDALTLLDTLPDLIMLGGREGVEILIPDSIDAEQRWAYEQVEDVHQFLGVCKYRIYDTPLYKEPVSCIPFMFTMTVNRAPVFLRRKEFIEMGGVNQEYAPFQCDDVDASIQAWLSGYKVGMYSCSFVRDFSRGGMRLFNNQKILACSERNWQRVYEKYSDKISSSDLGKAVDKANEKLALKNCEK